jgi:transcriptional regulator with GAF, ATPase, and Fis domain
LPPEILTELKSYRWPGSVRELKMVLNRGHKEGRRHQEQAARKNVRERILAVEECIRLLQHLPRHAVNVMQFAYLRGMRAGEIFNLNMDSVDLSQKLVWLGSEDTKTSEPRLVFLCD